MTDKESFINVPVEFTNTVLRVASALNVRDICVVGGAVRDCVLGAMSGYKTTPKDLDVILPEPLKRADKNPNILGVRKNSLGGAKVFVKNFGTVDVFQHYTNEPEGIIANYFDFNCNSLYYRMHDNKIIESVFFDEFMESKTISPQHIIYDKMGGTVLYGVPQTVMRAIKFQIQFKEKFNLKTNLSSDILYMIYNMNQDDEKSMKQYIYSHIRDIHLQQKILQSYQRIRG
jgi:hypothetical protein